MILRLSLLLPLILPPFLDSLLPLLPPTHLLFHIPLNFLLFLEIEVLLRGLLRNRLLLDDFSFGSLHLPLILFILNLRVIKVSLRLDLSDLDLPGSAVFRREEGVLLFGARFGKKGNGERDRGDEDKSDSGSDQDVDCGRGDG